jgi:hypothetical protein
MPARTSQLAGTGSMSVLSQQVRDVSFPLGGSLSNQVYSFVQSYEISALCTSSVTNSTFSANSFTVNSLDQVTSLAQVFDQYKIKHVQVTMVPRLEVMDAAAGNAGLLTSVIDYDDATVLTSVGQALDFQNALTCRGTDTQVRCFIPHVATAAYSGTFTSFANEEAPWIDWNSPSVAHYGLKTAWTVTSSVFTVDAIVRVHIQCRNIR